MSDLAPFVASTIRDKVVSDMMDEINALKSRLEESRRVLISGPEGFPVYAKAQLNDAVPHQQILNHHQHTKKDVKGNKDKLAETISPSCSNNGGIAIPVSIFEHLQLRLGAYFVAQLDDDLLEGFVEEYNRVTMQAQVHLYFKHGTWMSVRIGPISEERFRGICHYHNSNLDPEDILDDILDERNNLTTVYLDCVLFSGPTGASFVTFDDHNNHKGYRESKKRSIHAVG
mmetsp:Transcript_8022/g.11572  ORF Transcript_8022/g.11572 Transcript_8022/m.11572 type:complete len:229 (-) Transcript_8022:2105-2791(-)